MVQDDGSERILSAQVVGLWATVNNLPSFGPQAGILLVDISKRATEALANEADPIILADVQKFIDALDLVCLVGAVQQREAIRMLERYVQAT